VGNAKTAPPSDPARYVKHVEHQEFMDRVRPRWNARHPEPPAAKRLNLQQPSERRQLAELADDDLQALTVSNRPRSHWARKLKREHGLTDHLKTIEKHLGQRNLPPRRTSLP